MKQCLICLAHVDEKAPTCPLCGEASWDEDANDPADVTTADASPRAKAVRRMVMR